MGFFGLGNRGTNYRNQWEQFAPWNFQQAQDWTRRSEQFQNRADPYAQWGYNYNQDIVQQGGLPSPGQIRQTGSEVLPGVPETQARRWERWGTIADAARNIPGAYDTTAAINANLDTQGNIIGAAEQRQETLINDLTRQLRAAEAAGHTDVVQNIKDQLASLESLYGTEYGRLRRAGEETYGRLGTSAEEAWGSALKDIERLRPGGEFQTALVGRSYAPVIRSTAETLRRGGIEPGSAQAAGAMQRALTARARGMDEAAARGISEYVAAKTGTTLGREAARERLGLGAFGYETGLTREQVGATAGARREAGQSFRSEVIRNLGANQGISASEAEAKSTNLENTLKRNIELLGDRNKATLLSRAMEIEDWNRVKEVMGGMNQEELTQLGLSQMEFGAGMEYTGARLGREDQAMANMLGLTAQDYQRATTAATLARQYGMDAADVYEKLYKVEATNAGWGTKLILAGLAIGGLASGGGGNVQGGALSPAQLAAGGYFNTPLPVRYPSLSGGFPGGR